MRYSAMTAMRTQVVAFVCMVGIALSTAEAQRLPCRAVDAFDKSEQQRAEELLRIKKGDIFSWSLDGVKAGTVDVEIVYACTGKGGSIITIELGGETLEATTKNTGKDNKGRPRSISVPLGKLKIGAAAGPLVLRATKAADPVLMQLKHLTISGTPLAGASVAGYALPVLERKPVEVVDCGIDGNSLSWLQKLLGWKLLFNGRDLTGWVGFRKEAVPPAWMAKDGTLFLDKESKKEGGDLLTLARFSDFDLRLQWKIGPQGNSGILLRTLETRKRPWETAIEMQVGDGGKYKGLHAPGVAYALFAPEATPAKPLGEWNDVRVKVKGNHYQLWLNETLTADFVVGSDSWLKAVDASKWWFHPGLGLNREGHIALQDHGNPVWYRNIRIREL